MSMRWRSGGRPRSTRVTKPRGSGIRTSELGSAGCNSTGATQAFGLTFILLAIERYRAGFDWGRYCAFLARVTKPASDTTRRIAAARITAVLMDLIRTFSECPLTLYLIMIWREA
jgi:hypothetical protein